MRFWFGYLVVLLLAGCSAAVPEATVLPTAVAMGAIIVTDLPTATIMATETATLPPTPLPQPVPITAVPTATAVPPPTATATPSPAPTAEPSPTPEPSPTSEYACRPAAELTAVRPVQIVANGPWPRSAAWDQEVYTGSTANNMIHIGFDVEGSPAYLDELLDVLDRRGVKTTMFILGSWAEQNPGWVEAFVRRGHELANHAYSHSNMKEMPAEAVLAELERTEAIVQAATGQTTKPWFRPPFGSRSDVSIQAAYEAGWTTVIWSGSTEDWREGVTADAMCITLREGSFPGAILYSHTYRADVPETVDRFIGEMQSRGFVFVPMSVIMSSNSGAYLVNP